MAHGKSLELREIQPNQNYTPVSIAPENAWRRLSKAMAKDLGISRKRLNKAVKRGKIYFEDGKVKYK